MENTEMKEITILTIKICLVFIVSALFYWGSELINIKEFTFWQCFGVSLILWGIKISFVNAPKK